MAEQVLGFRIEVKGTDQQTQQLSKLGGEVDQLKARIKLLNDIQRQGTPLTQRQTKEKALLTTQLKATSYQYNQLNKEILQNNGVMKKSTGLFGGFKSAITSSMTSMLGWTAAIGGAVAIVKNVVGVIVDFDKASSKLEAVLGATKQEMGQLRQQAKDLGATTAYTATNVLELQTELAKLGFPTQDIRNMTASTLDAAAALGSELGEQAALTGAVLKQYSFDSKETGRINDVLAKSASSSALSFESLSTALPIVGATAATAGVSLERTTALLGTLADRGIDASTSATSLRNIFLTLAEKGLTYEEAMAKINTATDKNAASFDLFGKRGATAGVILANTGDTVEELEAKLLDADGAAKKMADTMLDNLAGDATKFQSAWEGLILSVEDGEGVFSQLARQFTQYFTGVLGMLTELNNSDWFGAGVASLSSMNPKMNEFLTVTDKATGKTKELSITQTDLYDAAQKNSLVLEALNEKFRLGEIDADMYAQGVRRIVDGVETLSKQERENAKVFDKLAQMKKNAQLEEQKALQASIEEQEKAEKESKKRAKEGIDEAKKAAQEKEKERLQLIEDQKKLEDELFVENQRRILSESEFEIQELIRKNKEKLAIASGNAELEAEILRQQKLDIQAIEDEAAQKKLESEKKHADNAIALGLENKQARIDAGLNNPDATPEEMKAKYDEQRALDDEIYQLELQKAQEQFDNGLITDAERKELTAQAELDYTNRLIDINQKEVDAKLAASKAKADLQMMDVDIANKSVQLVASLMGESKQAQIAALVAENAAGIAKAVISNNIANAGALATPQAIATSGVAAAPVILRNNILTGLNIAGIIAATAKGIGGINSAKMEQGGLVEGASHRQGGIQMFHKTGQHLGEMEGNEYIVSAKRVREIGKDNLDAINFGGVNPAVSGYFANGGQVPNVQGISTMTSQLSSSAFMEDLSDLISEKMAETVLRTKVVNNAVDTFQTAQNVKNTENSLKFG